MTALPSARFAAIQIGLNLALCAMLLHSLATQPGPPVGGDFVIYWAATQLGLQGHAMAIYDLPTLAAIQDTVKAGMIRHAGWFYPPMFLLLLLPLGLLAYLPAWISYSLAGSALYLWSLRRWLPTGAGLIWLLAFPGLWLNLVAGQNGLITVALMALTAHWLPRQPGRAGIPLGLLVMKPHLGVLLPLWLLNQRAWRTLASAVAVAVLFMLACTLAFGWPIWTGFADGLSHGGAYLTGGIPINRLASVYGLARRVGLMPDQALLLHGLIAVVALGLMLTLWRRSQDPHLNLAALVAATLLFSPYLYDYDTTWLLLPMACLHRLGARTGWLPGEQAWLLLAWLSPLYPQTLLPLAGLTAWQPAAPLNIALLLLLLQRTQSQPANSTPRASP